MPTARIQILNHDRTVGTIDEATPLPVTASGGSSAQDGPGVPTAIESQTHAEVDLAASTNNQQIIAAPGAGKQIWVHGMFLMADTAAGTIVLHDSAGTSIMGTIALSDEGGFVLPISGNFVMPWFKLGGNLALQADTGACTVDGIVVYSVVTP